MKLLRLSLVFPIIVGCLIFTGDCGGRTVGSGKVTSETRALSGFHGVELVCPGTLDIAPSDKEELVVEAEDNLLPLIETKVKPDGILVITFKDHESVKTTKPLSFKLSAKTLDKIVLTGSGSIHVGGKLSAGNQTIKLPGSGSITVDDLETGALTVSLEGSGTIELTGSAASQSLRLDGSGTYKAGVLKTETAKISVNGSGQCKVWAQTTLDVEIAGSGEVEYVGRPVLKQRVTGSGVVSAIGEKGG